MIFLLSGVFGAVIGSFLNVCIFRLPKNQSLISPNSYCPECHRPILFYHNIPVLSFVLLGGKCALCRTKISLQYPFVELLSAAITIFTLHKYGPTRQFIFFTGFTYFLIVIAFIDWKTRLILNKVLIALLIFGVAGNLVFAVRSWQDALSGFILGGSSILLFGLLGRLLFKKESMGMGDVKFAAVAGFFIGWKFILLALYLGFVFALITVVILKLFRIIPRIDYVPMGPFLVTGLLVFLFWGERLIQFYRNLYAS